MYFSTSNLHDPIVTLSVEMIIKSFTFYICFDVEIKQAGTLNFLYMYYR